MKLILFFFILLNFFAEPIEKFSSEKAKIGEKINYSLTEILSDTCQIPEKDFLMEKESPYAEILEIEKTGKEIKLEVVFYKSGKFKIPIICKNFRTSLEIEIETSLENEKEQIDIKSPISFSGNYLYRVIILILIILGIISIFIYFLKKNKFYRKRMDADSIKVLEQEVEETYRSKLLSLLKQTEIQHKEFIFLLSAYIKERLELKLNYPTQHLTQKELSEVLIDKFQISNIEILSMESYFNSVKYMPNEENIPQIKAIALYELWTKLLK